MNQHISKVTAPQSKLQRFEIIFMAFVCVISLLAAAGWMFNLPILTSLRSEYIPMAPATALIFLGLCGIWLIRRVFPAKRGIRILIQTTLTAMLIIVLVLALRYFTGFGPDLEKLLYPDPPLFGQFSSARISPLSALGFLLAIPAFLLLIGSKPDRRTKGASAALSLAVFVLGGLVSLGYLYGAPPFYGGTLIPMAITSALAFMFLSLGLLMAAGPDAWPVNMYEGHSLRARLMRTFIPVSLLIVLLQGFLSTAANPWVVNPAVRVGIAALVACLIVMFIISFIAKNLSAEIDRGRKAEEALLRSEIELRALFAGMTDVVIVYNTEGRYIEIAPTNPANLYRQADKMLGKTIYEVLPKEQSDYLLTMIRTAIQNNQVVRGEYGLKIDNKEIYFSASASRLSENTAIVVAHDITERKRMEQEIRNLSLTDELTGLYNRRGFALLAEHEMKMAQREKRRMLLFFGDVDDLKTINDTHGHAQGDLALKEVSSILRESFREADILARFSGDEFVILAVDASMESAQNLTSRIQAALERRNQQSNPPYRLSLSLGISHYDPKAPSTVNELIARADVLMYQEKQGKKGIK